VLDRGIPFDEGRNGRNGRLCRKKVGKPSITCWDQAGKRRRRGHERKNPFGLGAKRGAKERGGVYWAPVERGWPNTSANVLKKKSSGLNPLNERKCSDKGNRYREKRLVTQNDQ